MKLASEGDLFGEVKVFPNDEEKFPDDKGEDDEEKKK
jgi:hypothetical protein